jgi:tripartite-type tricarboxylate transporter receptor subunit TctC
VDAVQQQVAPHVRIIIYARAGVTADQLVRDAAARFNIHLQKPVEVSSFGAATLPGWGV